MVNVQRASISERLRRVRSKPERSPAEMGLLLHSPGDRAEAGQGFIS